MKKFTFMALAAAISFPVFAQSSATAVCDGGAGGDKNVAASTNFLRAPGGATTGTAFVMKCSNNVFLAYNESATAIAVGSASKKGKNTFGGTSEGGQVKVIGACSGECSATSASGAIPPFTSSGGTGTGTGTGT